MIVLEAYVVLFLQEPSDPVFSCFSRKENITEVGYEMISKHNLYSLININ